jgi:uncharacterized protein YndB with AHSA1/START domain
VSDTSTHRLEHDYATTADEVWRLWTTAEGIEQWWSPDGFEVAVQELDLRPGGSLVYTMTAVGPEQIEFLENHELPLVTESRKTFAEVDAPRRLAYLSLVDFAGVDPYEHLTVVDIEPTASGVHVVMTVEPMHDEVWTERLLAGRKNELENLAAAVAS